MDVGTVEAPTIEERAMQTLTTIGLDSPSRFSKYTALTLVGK
jgi:hypothetical protein